MIASWTDFKYRIIPNLLLLIAGGAFLALRLAEGTWIYGLIGAVLLGSVGLVVALASQLGMGDVKYLAVVGLALGPLVGWLALFLAAAFGLVMGLWVLIRHQTPRFPFGPCIAAGSLLAAIWGPDLLRAFGL